MLFAYRDTTLLDGWLAPPRRRGGEASQRLCDVDGDNRLDVVLEPTRAARCGCSAATASRWRRSTAASRCARTACSQRARPDAPGFDRDRAAARVAAHARDRRHRRRPRARDRRLGGRARLRLERRRLGVTTGFPVRVNPDFSRPADRTQREPRQARLHRLARARRPRTATAALEIVIPRARPARLRVERPRRAAQPASRSKLRDPAHARGAEIITTRRGRRHHRRRPPRDRHADRRVRRQPAAPGAPASRRPAGRAAAQPRHTSSPTRSAAARRTYALDARRATMLPGWPVKPERRRARRAAAGRRRAYDHVLGNLDGDAEARGRRRRRLRRRRGLTTADGVDAHHLRLRRPAAASTSTRSKVLNLFENPIVADLDGQPRARGDAAAG